MEIKLLIEKYKHFIYLLVTFFVLLSTIITGKTLVDELKLIDKQILSKAQLDYDLTLLDSILVDRKKYENELSVLKYSLPDSYNDISYFASILEEKAKEQGQTLENLFDKKAKEEKEGFSSLTFRMTTLGDYSTYSNYLSAIANLPYHTQLDSLKVEKGEGGISALAIIRIFIGKI